MLERLENFSLKFIRYFYGVVMLLIIGICLFCSGQTYLHKKELDYANWQYMLPGIGVIGAFCFLLRFLEKKQVAIKHDKIVMGAFSALLFVGLIGLTYHYYFKTGWDAQTVEGTANLVALGQFEDAQNKYFSYYPNNVFLTFVFSIIIKIGYLVGIQNYYFSIIIFQCFLFAAAGFFVYCCAEKLLNSVWALGVWCIYVVFVGLSPWVVIPYSDATGMVFPILMFYLYLCIREKKWVGGNLCLLAFLCYVGYQIKPQIAIIGIAILIVTGLDMLAMTGEKRKECLKKVPWLLAGILAGVLIVTAGIRATRLEIDKELTFGMPHFFMMGMNAESNGVINIEDQDFSMYIATAAERNQANLEVAFERIGEMGVGGLLEHWMKKILLVFSDGSFAWWEEGEFYSEEMYDGNYSLRSILSSYFYEHGSNYNRFLSNMQTLWMGILACAGTIFVSVGKDKKYSVLLLSIVGLFLFEMIFEARARYLFTYAPIFVLLAVCGVCRIMNRKKKD